MEARQQSTAEKTTRRQSTVSNQSSTKRGFIKKRGLMLIFSVLVLIVAAFIVGKYFISPMLTGVKGDQYQAVFLDGGQVYFGKLGNPASRYVTLTDVYYLKTNDKESDQSQQNQTREPQLIKLGDELHGPEDEMRIHRDQISFWENLKDDSKVVEAIKAYKKK